MSLFPPWADSVFRAALLALGGVLLGVPLFLMAWVRSPLARGQEAPVQQPIPFDHRHHVVDDRIHCGYCHFDAERADVAGVPDTRLCMHCHVQIWRESPLLEPLRASWSEGRPIRWRRVHDLPDFVFFSHRAHVVAGVGCETCHGRVDRMASVHQVAPLTMAWCIDCHRDPSPHLRPRSEVTAMGVAPDPRRGQRLAEERGIRAPTDCTACHR